MADVMATNRAGMAWRVQTAQQFTARISLDRQPASIQRSVAALLDAIATRGRKGSGVAILHRGSNDQLVTSTLQALQPGAQHITSLDLPYSTTTILTAAATALPHLTKLRVRELHAPLPHPSTFPSLADLHVDAVPGDWYFQRYTVRSVAPYLPQLSSLAVEQDFLDRNYDLMGIPAHASSDLTSLKLGTRLGAELVSWCVEGRLNVTHLSVSALGHDGTDWSSSTWQCRWLHVEDGFVRLGALAMLPGTADGQPVTVTSSKPMMLGLAIKSQMDDRVFQALPRYRFPQAFEVFVCFGVDEEEQQVGTPLLRPTLQRLRPLSQPGTVLRLSILWPITQEMVACLAEAGQHWPRLQLTMGHMAAHGLTTPLPPLDAINIHNLNDMDFEWLRQYAPALHNLEAHVCHVDHQSEQPWPCRQMSLGAMEATVLEQLGVPAPGAQLQVKALSCYLPVTQEHFDLVLSQWTRLADTSLTLSVEELKLAAGFDLPASTLSECLQPLWRMGAAPSQRLILWAWPMGHDTEALLPSVPITNLTVTLQMDLDWCNDPMAYRSLGAAIPVGYSVWELEGDSYCPLPSNRLLVAMLVSAGRQRREQQPLHVRLKTPRRPNLVAMMRASGVPPHITVECY